LVDRAMELRPHRVEDVRTSVATTGTADSGILRAACEVETATSCSPPTGGLGVMRADASGITSLPIEGVGKAVFADWR
jgi:hypothetical protein